MYNYWKGDQWPGPPHRISKLSPSAYLGANFVVYDSPDKRPNIYIMRNLRLSFPFLLHTHSRAQIIVEERRIQVSLHDFHVVLLYSVIQERDAFRRRRSWSKREFNLDEVLFLTDGRYIFSRSESQPFRLDW
jgi:hypothetical protein